MFDIAPALLILYTFVYIIVRTKSCVIFLKYAQSRTARHAINVYDLKMSCFFLTFCFRIEHHILYLAFAISKEF